MLLSAIKPAAYSLSPSAKSFHTTTMAMQRAKPIRITPIIYSGYPFKKSNANENIKIGPIIQFKNKDAPKTFVFLNTSPICSYFTLANGGYIIKISPIANGTFVVPLENEFIKPLLAGTK